MKIDIDWSKAPEGFPLWLEGTNEEHRKHSGWYRDAGQVFEGASGGQWRACREGQFFTVHRNLEPSIWTGEGLPPVGTVCEHSTDDNKADSPDGAWKRVKIVGHHQFNDDEYICAVWVSGLEVSYSSEGPHFRPIRTPEHIESERKKNCLGKLNQLWDADTARTDFMEAVYEIILEEREKTAND